MALSAPLPYNYQGQLMTGTDPVPYILTLILGALQNGAGGGGGGGGGIVIPASDEVDYTYYGSTNNIETAVYKLSGSTVATLTFTYVGGVPGSNDANIASIVRS